MRSTTSPLGGEGLPQRIGPIPPPVPLDRVELGEQLGECRHADDEHAARRDQLGQPRDGCPGRRPGARSRRARGRRRTGLSRLARAASGRPRRAGGLAGPGDRGLAATRPIPRRDSRGAPAPTGSRPSRNRRPARSTAGGSPADRGAPGSTGAGDPPGMPLDPGARSTRIDSSMCSSAEAARPRDDQLRTPSARASARTSPSPAESLRTRDGRGRGRSAAPWFPGRSGGCTRRSRPG